jgi:hypothetical protein
VESAGFSGQQFSGRTGFFCPVQMTMENLNEEKLIRHWILYSEAKEGSPEREEYYWAESKLTDYIETDPELVWKLLLNILSREISQWAVGLLAAGPLEDLLSDYGPQLIDRVEKEARINPKFRIALTGVWQGGMTDDIWKRVQEAQ